MIWNYYEEFVTYTVTYTCSNKAFLQTSFPSALARTTPLEDVLQFKAEFEAEYGTVHPTFYQGSYSQVRTQ